MRWLHAKEGSEVQEEKPLEFDSACERCGEALFRRCQRVCRNREDAEDLLQEVLVRATAAWDRYERKGGELAWLCGILANCRREQCARLRWREVPLETVLEVASGESEAEWVLRLDLRAAVAS